MNKKIVWIIIAVIVVLAIVAYVMNKNNSGYNGGLQVNSGDKTPQTGDSAGLETPDDDFSEIDDAMNYIE